MQELRLVLIIVGLLAIGALLFHGLWTSKKEGKGKFGSKPLGKLTETEDEKDYSAQRAFAPEDDFEIIKKERKEPEFGALATEPLDFDPLVSSDPLDEVMPSISTNDDVIDSQASQDDVTREIESPVGQELSNNENISSGRTPSASAFDKPLANETSDASELSDSAAEITEVAEEPEMEVIVLNVHCVGDEPFVGTALFDSMLENGLIYGEMDIFHRHSDLSGTGKVLFSVANMMQPGTLAHDDPATFTTKGISFFMTLPCFGEADQNFKVMLRTAQQIADDLGAQVLDETRAILTPNRIDAYRKQVRDFTKRHDAATK
ncbi:cell division protein ZipA [Vibrio tapetis]|uniref:Cell division protein ZipA n=1 Tax=Vibrio tapetis subsp. tapetis TaxID=1671868 RepID=A0A2N8ZBN3_9VIBR|nr:cell division protein ZipA [Vibrio tapetis]SON49324.1 Cell division protein ZipA homolog [Vibrio tapetis subsp. tapetis]